MPTAERLYLRLLLVLWAAAMVRAALSVLA